MIIHSKVCETTAQASVPTPASAPSTPAGSQRLLLLFHDDEFWKTEVESRMFGLDVLAHFSTPATCHVFVLSPVLPPEDVSPSMFCINCLIAARIGMKGIHFRDTCDAGSRSLQVSHADISLVLASIPDSRLRRLLPGSRKDISRRAPLTLPFGSLVPHRATTLPRARTCLMISFASLRVDTRQWLRSGKLRA